MLAIKANSAASDMLNHIFARNDIPHCPVWQHRPTIRFRVVFCVFLTVAVLLTLAITQSAVFSTEWGCLGVAWVLITPPVCNTRTSTCACCWYSGLPVIRSLHRVRLFGSATLAARHKTAAVAGLAFVLSFIFPSPRFDRLHTHTEIMTTSLAPLPASEVSAMTWDPTITKHGKCNAKIRKKQKTDRKSRWHKHWRHC